MECKVCGQNTFKRRSWGHIVAIEHAFSVLNNCFNEQQLNSLEDYMYIHVQASVMLQFNEMIVILSEFLGFILKNFEHNESIIGT